MSATLQSILGDGVILPCDLLPDDTPLYYEDGKPVCEMDYVDPDGENASDWRAYDRYVDLALEYYNHMHGTDYKLIKEKGPPHTCLETYLSADRQSAFIHCGFGAVPSTDVESESSSAKHFCVDLDEDTEELIACRMVDGLTYTGCKRCGVCTCEDSRNQVVFGCDTSGSDEDVNRTKSEKSVETRVPPLSTYSGYLADGVTLSDKAKLRLEFTLLALAYYNKKQHTDYKLVDALPYCISTDSGYFVAHCNFIARQNSPADASNKLFFGELERRKNVWIVVACRVVRGKTTAGCHHCPKSLRGKKVIHPTRGFRYGLHPYFIVDGPKLRPRRRP